MSKKLYKLFCNDESSVVTLFADTPPTVCPNNSVHNIDQESVILSDDYYGKIISQEMSTGDFETTHITMNIVSGVPGAVTTYDVSWPMDILLWKTEMTSNAAMVGDIITVMAAPETTVGVLTAAVSIGTTVLPVNPEIFNYLLRGYTVTLNDGTHKNFLGRCIMGDPVNNTITVETALANSFAAGVPVQMSIYVLKDIYMGDTSTITIGGKGMRGKLLPAGTILRVYYTNNSGTAKTFRWRPEYYNNG